MRPSGCGALLTVNLRAHVSSGAQKNTYIDRANGGIMLLGIIGTAKASAQQRLDGRKHC
jgi:hypothetical protein